MHRNIRAVFSDLRREVAAYRVGSAARYGDLLSDARAAVARLRAGDESPRSMASVLRCCFDALRLIRGSWPSESVVRASSAAALGLVAPMKGEVESMEALTGAAYLLAAYGKGCHVITADDRSTERLVEFMTPVASLVECDVGAVRSDSAPASPSSPATDRRRQAYSSAITVGSWSELASDYLRDHLHGTASELVQRALYAAIIVDVDHIAGDLALVPVRITAPRSRQHRGLSDDTGTAARLRRGDDYLIQDDKGIIFSPSAARAIVRSSGAGDIAPVAAVTTLQRVERAILGREGLIPAEERYTLADITLQAFIRAYGRVGGLSSSNLRSMRLLRELYQMEAVGVTPVWGRLAAARSARRPSPVGLATERIIDEQRSAVYRVRESLVEILSGGSTTGSAALHEAVRVFAEFCTTSNGHSDSDIALALHEHVARLSGAVGDSATIDMVRRAQLGVLLDGWSAHLERLRLLKRNLYSLYEEETGVTAAFGRDATALFSAFRVGLHHEFQALLVN